MIGCCLASKTPRAAVHRVWSSADGNLWTTAHLGHRDLWTTRGEVVPLSPGSSQAAVKWRLFNPQTSISSFSAASLSCFNSSPWNSNISDEEVFYTPSVKIIPTKFGGFFFSCNLTCLLLKFKKKQTRRKLGSFCHNIALPLGKRNKHLAAAQHWINICGNILRHFNSVKKKWQHHIHVCIFEGEYSIVFKAKNKARATDSKIRIPPWFEVPWDARAILLPLNQDQWPTHFWGRWQRVF